MTTEIYFGNRSEPAQMKTVLCLHKKRSFRKIIFCGNCLKQIIVQPCIKRTNGSWITTEYSVGKRINLILLDSHFRP